MGNFTGHQGRNFIVVFSSIQKARPYKDIISVNRTDIHRIRIVKKVKMPGKMIGFSGLYELIEYSDQRIKSLGVGIQLVIVTQIIVYALSECGFAGSQNIDFGDGARLDSTRFDGAGIDGTKNTDGN